MAFRIKSRAKGTEQPGSDVDLAIFTTAQNDISGAVQAEFCKRGKT